MTETTIDPTAALHAALSDARERANAVGKDSQNSHHRYRYASAEHILVESRRALRDSGLAVVPTKSDIVMVGEMFVLQRSFRLTHRNGGAMDCSMSWPLEITRGKTPDKAAAGAETTSFAYFMRTTLMMPRLDQDDMDHDSHEPPRMEHAAPAVSTGVSAKGRAALKRIASGGDEAKVKASAFVSGLADKFSATDDDVVEGFTRADLDALVEAIA